MDIKLALPDDFADQVAAAVVARLQAKQEPPANDSPYMDKVKAAAYLGISRGKLDTLIKQGLPASKLNRRYVINRHDLDSWIEQHK